MEIRLQKYMAGCGVASRRASEQVIQAGRVTVNGAVVMELGAKIDDENDVVAVDGKPIMPPHAHTYVLLNKPVGYVTTAADQFGRPAVVDLVKAVPARLFPVGRLDYDTSGLLLMTDDGDLTYALTHPKHEVQKEYIATVQGNPNPAALVRFRAGIELDGRMTAPAEIGVLRRRVGEADVRITITEGRNRQVRRMLSAIGHEVKTLTRVRIGALTLGDLAPGMYRLLSNDEVQALRS